MKRLFSILAILAIVPVLCFGALAEVYTHPVMGYSFTIPEAWYVVDGANAADLLTRLSEDAEQSALIRSQLSRVTNDPIVILYENDRTSPLFANNINIVPMDIGAQMDIGELFTFMDDFTNDIRNSVDDFDTLFPLTLTEMETHRIAIMGGRFSANDIDLQLWIIMLTSGKYLYQFTLTALPEYSTDYLNDMGYMADSFVAP